jgi:hypothetical protein
MLQLNAYYTIERVYMYIFTKSLGHVSVRSESSSGRTSYHLLKTVCFSYIRLLHWLCCSVGIAIHYGLEGPGNEFRWWGARFSRPALRPTRLLYSGYRVFTGGKAVRAWRWPPTVPLLHLWAFVAYSRVNLTFTFTLVLLQNIKYII